MNRQDTLTVIQHLEAGNVSEALILLKESLASFPITSVHREDLFTQGFLNQNVSDEEMEAIARKMADSYIESQFWLDLSLCAREFGVPHSEDFVDYVKECLEEISEVMNDGDDRSRLITLQTYIFKEDAGIESLIPLSIEEIDTQFEIATRLIQKWKNEDLTVKMSMLRNHIVEIKNLG